MNYNQFRFLLMVLLMGLLVGLLYGCSTVKEIPITKVEYRMAEIPDTYLVIEPLPQPPNREQFINASDEEARAMLVRYSRTLMGVVIKLNNKLESIKELVNEQTLAIEQRNKP